jgi:hypothetical protein
VKKLITLIAFVFCLNGHGQSTFNPFKLDNVEWIEDAAYGSPPPNNVRYFYKLCGDTLYNSVNYKKLYVGSVTYIYPCCPPGYVKPTSPASYSFTAFFRQDTLTKTNYILNIGSATESLLCCYNFNIGDTLKTMSGAYISCAGTNNFSCTNTINTVIKTDSLPVGNRKFKIYYTDTTQYVTYCGSTIKGMFLIEGIGNCYGLNSAYCAPFEGAIGVSYMYFDTVCANLHALSLNNPNQSNSFIISPNPASTILNIECETVNEKTEITISDMLGNSIYHSAFTTQHKTISVADLTEGVYNISIIGSKGIINKRLVIVK